MIAAPISVNRAAGGNAGTGAAGQAAKASTLPAFAQVMAQKQTEASAPRDSAASGAEQANTANGSTDATAQKSSDSGPLNAKSAASVNAETAKKSDGKISNGAGAGKSATHATAQVSPQIVAQVPAIPDGQNGAASWVGGVAAVIPASTAVNEAVSTAATEAASGDATEVKVGTSAAPADGAVTRQPGPAVSDLANPIAADSKNLPVSLLSEPVVPTTSIAEGSATSVPKTEPANGATSTPATASSDQMNSQTPVAAPTVASASEPPSSMNAANPVAAVAAQSLSTAGNDPATQSAARSADTAAGATAAAANEAKTGDLGSATAGSEATNTQSMPKIQGKRSVQEILHVAAVLAGKEAQAPAHVSVNAAKDVVGTVKEKSSGNGSGTQTGVETVAGAKNESPMGVKAEPVSPEIAEAPAKPGAAKAGSNIKRNSAADASASGNSGSEGSVGESKDPGAGADPNAVHGATPAVQNDPGNFAAGAANAMASPVAITGKDSVNATQVKAGDGSNNGAPELPDADDEAPLPNESRVVNVAQLAGDQGHSQVRIAMQADQLGQVELHATVRGQQVGAAITVEKKEAHAAMAAEMPSLQQALEGRQLRVGEVVLMQGAMHSTEGDAGNAAAEQQRRGQTGTTYQQVENETMYESGVGTILESGGIFDDSGRLSVRA